MHWFDICRCLSSLFKSEFIFRKHDGGREVKFRALVQVGWTQFAIWIRVTGLTGGIRAPMWSSALRRSCSLQGTVIVPSSVMGVCVKPGESPGPAMHVEVFSTLKMVSMAFQ